MSDQDPASFYRTDPFSGRPYLALRGTHKEGLIYQDLIGYLKKEKPDVFEEGRDGSIDVPNVVVEADTANAKDSAAVRVLFGEGKLFGYFPQHTAAFYYDTLVEAGVIKVEAGIGYVYKYGEWSCGSRVYAGGTDTPLASYPGSNGWDKHGGNNFDGYWTDPTGEQKPRPWHRYEEAMRKVGKEVRWEGGQVVFS